MLDRIFTVDTLNFCFWTGSGEEPFTVLYKNKNYTGYWALCAAINRAIDEQIPITEPQFMKTVDLQTLLHIFRSATSTQIPLIHERVQVLNEAGRVLIDEFNSSVQTLVDRANGNAQAMMQLVISNFSSYNDSMLAEPALFRNFKQVDDISESNDLPPARLCFFKRAQILVADIWACFASEKAIVFRDISLLTMFADYRVPQILAWLGAIEYSDSLMALLKSEEELDSGCRTEIEIRGCSIHAVELIRKELESLQEENNSKDSDTVVINSVLTDFLLWDYATAHKKKLAEIPVHHVKSIYY